MSIPQFIFLTEEFYNTFPESAFPEIERKPLRPYIQLHVVINDVQFAIPLRSNIRHGNVLWTDKENNCGVDFSKAVVITDEKFIDTSNQPVIRPKEFNNLRGKNYIITKKMIKYISDYKKAKAKIDIPHNKQFCAYSTLQYFEQYI